MITSGRAFTTKQPSLSIQECTVAERPAASGITGQTSEEPEAMARPHHPDQHSERYGDTAAVREQTTYAQGSHKQPLHSALVQTDHATDSVPSQCPTTNAASAPLTEPRGPGHDDQSNTTPIDRSDMHLASLDRKATDNVTDTDYTQTSADESDSQSEKDDSEADDTAEQPTETHIPLKYQIPDDILRAAMAAPENTKASFWSSNLYRGPENKKILVHYCKTKEVAERVAQHFVGEKVIGFDIEWKPWTSPTSIKKNVSLIQLACEDRIALFHVALFSGVTAAQLMPPTLKAILESPEVYKVGVAVKGDFSRVVKFLDVEPQGVFELSRLYNLVEFSVTDPSRVTNKLVGLAAQVHQHLQLPLYKGGQLVDDPEDTFNVRSSDWSLSLNHQQIQYAAADAYAGFRLYDVLELKRKQMKPTPPRPLLCDYDSKPKPRSSESKPRKKRTTVARTDHITSPAEEAVSAPAEQEDDSSQQLEEDAKQSQDTESYETAEEDLDSHQLEGEDTAPSEKSYESGEESNEGGSIASPSLLAHEENTESTVLNQRRVGRINVSWLKGPDPGYPVLPKFPPGENSSASFREDSVDMSDIPEPGKTSSCAKSTKDFESDDETDEFDDSELEEALHDLDIDSRGNLTGAVVEFANSTTAAASAHSNSPDFSVERAKGKPTPSEARLEADKDLEKEEQELINPLNDPSVVEQHLDDPTHSTTSSPSLVPGPSTTPPTAPHTPEYDQATTWAQSYLASTIPSPASRAPSHIRATIPHLRAFHMWHHQGLALSEVARHLRDPPLAESTVGNYILQAITLERMEYDREAVRGVLMGMPEALRRGKWKVLAEKVGAR